MLPHTPQAFSKSTFDYLVIGGGNTGLPLAVRLSENPNVSVGLIEAGVHVSGDPLIDVPGHVAQSLGNPKYDWNFATTPQPGAAGRSIAVPRGKLFGGSSAINFMGWDRASKQEYDAWKTLSDSDGWDWDSILPYFRNSEQVSTAPDPYPSLSESKDHVVSSGIHDAHGKSGPVKVSYNVVYNDVIPHYVKGWNAIGVPTNANPYGGIKNGVYNVLNSIDVEGGVRSEAANSYLPAASNRKNLVILSGARATQILFKDAPDSEGNLVATGVSFDVDGTSFSASASKEVILSAGVIQTPQLLELSGIGNKKLLSDLGIKTLVDLPGVGENLQDHIFAPIQFLAKPGIRTFDEIRTNAAFKEEQTALYQSQKKGWLAGTENALVFLPVASSTPKEKLVSKLQLLEESLKDDTLNALQKAQYEIQIAWMKAGEVPDIEIVLFSKGFIMPEPDKNYFIVMAGIQHPFSRGSVHVNSKDPLAAPIIDPRYLSNEFDLDMLVDAYKLVEKFADTAPMKNVIQSVSFPPAPLPGDAELSGYIRAAFASGSHQMGTCPMARRELGGVVDSHLKVHGTANLRIADTSIIPMPVAAHIQATAYAIGEKAATLIKQGL